MRGVAARGVVGVVVGLVAGVALGVPSLAGASARTSSLPASPPCTSASYSLAVTATLSGSTSFSLTVTGQVDFTADAVSATVTLPGNLPIAALDGMTVQGMLVGGTVYVQVPAAFSGFVGGASWVSLALPSGVNSLVDGLLAEGAAWCANSHSLVTTLSRHAAVSSLGSTTVGTVSAKGTEVRQSGKKVLRALRLQHLPKNARAAFGRSSMRVDVWSNDQGELSQLDVTGPSLSVDLELTDVNQPVSITAPSGAVPLPSSIASMIGGAL